MSYRLVFGASGYIGGHLAPYLAAQGHQVRATARNIEVLESREWQGVELAQADALSPESLDDVLRDVDIAYYLVHSMAAGKDFPKLDAEAARNFAAAAARQGVRRIVYLGGLADETHVLPPHLGSRIEVGRLLAASGVPVVELRASIVIGSGSLSFEMVRSLVEHLPLLVTPRSCSGWPCASNTSASMRASNRTCQSS